MKKTLFILALCLATSLTFAQTPVIDTSVTSITCARIEPVKGMFTDSTLSYYLGAYVISDNLKNSATFYWCLMYGVKDSTGAISKPGAVSAQGNYTMTPEQYAQWCNSPSAPCNSYPLQVIGQAYGLTFPPVSSQKKK